MDVTQPLLHGLPHPAPVHLAAQDGMLERQWIPYDDLDRFFRNLYLYWRGKGLAVIVVTRIANLAALAFTAAVSAFLLLVLDWHALSSPCLLHDTCDLADVAIRRHPLQHGSALGSALKLLFLACFGLYWIWAACTALYEIRCFIDIKHFCKAHLFVADSALMHMTWPEVLHGVVGLQSHYRFSLRCELNEHDIVMRIMRKDDYLIGMLNMGVLDLHVPLPVLRRRPLLTTTVDWALRATLLDAMFDEHFELRREFVRSGAYLSRRARAAAALAALAAPFLLLFILLHFLLKNIERIYHHPSSLGTRRWSVYAYWRMREFGELPHFVETRLNMASKAAARYCAQFPAPITSAVASFVAYVAAATAGLIIAIMLTHDTLTERHAFGHTLVWWLAAVSVVLAVCRGLMEDEVPAYDPEAAMIRVAEFTHWVPSYWRGRAHSAEVRDEFQGLFQYQIAVFCEEAASVLLLPWLLAVALPRCSDDVAAFLKHCSTYHSGSGHICSMATFDIDRHGNPKYGGAKACARTARTHQGKLEKSLLTFAACYPSWRPSLASSQQFLRAIEDQADGADPCQRYGHARADNGEAGARVCSADVPAITIGGAWALAPSASEAVAAHAAAPRGSLHESLHTSGESSTIELAAVGAAADRPCGAQPAFASGPAARVGTSPTGAAPGGFAGSTRSLGQGPSHAQPTHLPYVCELRALDSCGPAHSAHRSGPPWRSREAVQYTPAASPEVPGSQTTDDGLATSAGVPRPAWPAHGARSAPLASGTGDRAHASAASPLDANPPCAAIPVVGRAGPLTTSVEPDTGATPAHPSLQGPGGSVASWRRRSLAASAGPGRNRPHDALDSVAGVPEADGAAWQRAATHSAERQRALHSALQRTYEQLLPDEQRQHLLAMSSSSWHSAASALTASSSVSGR